MVKHGKRTHTSLVASPFTPTSTTVIPHTGMHPAHHSMRRASRYFSVHTAHAHRASCGRYGSKLGPWCVKHCKCAAAHHFPTPTPAASTQTWTNKNYPTLPVRTAIYPCMRHVMVMQNAADTGGKHGENAMCTHMPKYPARPHRDSQPTRTTHVTHQSTRRRRRYTLMPCWCASRACVGLLWPENRLAAHARCLHLPAWPPSPRRDNDHPSNASSDAPPHGQHVGASHDPLDALQVGAAVEKA